MVFTRYGTFSNRQDELLKQMPINALRSLVEAPGDQLIRLYSYQSQEAWEAAEKRGYWAGSPNIQNDDENMRDFKNAYGWIQEKMKERVPDYSGDLPMWGWLKRPSTKPKKAIFQGTSGAIRLTVMVPRSRILFSDYDTWHSVLNSGPLVRTQQDHDDHCHLWHSRMTDEEFGLTPEYLQDIRSSWDRCLEFNPATSQAELDWGIPIKYFIPQACVDRFYWNEVVSVRRFCSKQG